MKQIRSVLLALVLLFATGALVFWYRNREQSIPLLLTTESSPSEAYDPFGRTWAQQDFYRFSETAKSYDFEVWGTVAKLEEHTNAGGLVQQLVFLNAENGVVIPISLGNSNYRHHVYSEAQAQLGKDTAVEVSKSYTTAELSKLLQPGTKLLVRYSVPTQYARTITAYKEYLANLQEEKTPPDLTPTSLILDFASIQLVVLQL